MSKITNPELLAPAGGIEALKAAIESGADAVYLGGASFSLRAKAKNFSEEELREAYAYAHAHHAKVYVTVNAFAHEEDLDDVRAYLMALKEVKPDALIIADTGVFSLAKEIVPEIPLHISTQSNNLNHATFRFWYDLGVRRVVAARELRLTEIAAIRERIPDDMEIECFVHGAMCMAYSGRCHMSAYLTGRDANRGACTQSCRWNYSVVEEKRPGMEIAVEETQEGTMIFAPDDLCMVAHLPELIDAGIGAFKIEGRTKTATYVKKVTSVYREAIDTCVSDKDLYLRRIPVYLERLKEGASRPFNTGFYFGNP